MLNGSVIVDGRRKITGTLFWADVAATMLIVQEHNCVWCCGG